jgi:hypothetical protein
MNDPSFLNRTDKNNNNSMEQDKSTSAPNLSEDSSKENVIVIEDVVESTKKPNELNDRIRANKSSISITKQVLARSKISSNINQVDSNGDQNGNGNGNDDDEDDNVNENGEDEEDGDDEFKIIYSKNTKTSSQKENTNLSRNNNNPKSLTNSSASIVKDTEYIQLDDDMSDESNNGSEPVVCAANLDDASSTIDERAAEQQDIEIIQPRFTNYKVTAAAGKPFKKRYFNNKNSKFNTNSNNKNKISGDDDELDLLTYFEEIENSNRPPLIAKQFS